MKKIFNILLVCIFILSLSGCFTMSGISPFAMNTKVDIPFSGTMNPCYGYENLTWGQSYKSIKDAGYPLTHVEDDDFYSCYIGSSERLWNSYSSKYYYSNTKYGHGEVNSTMLYFAFNRLYCVIDSFITTPSMEYLHKRYGKFSEENLASKLDDETIVAYYNNSAYSSSVIGTRSLEILVDNKGLTTVKIYDNYVRYANNYPTVEVLDKNYATESYKITPNEWVCYAALDVKNKAVNFTFLNQNKDGKYLFVGYSKSYDNPVLSYVRSGICWRNYTSGSYEIKIGTDISTKNYSSSDWKCLYNGKEYTYTYNSGESARENMSLFLENEKIILRHNDVVSEFVCNGEQLLETMEKFNVSWDEIDFAMSNEEF